MGFKSGNWLMNNRTLLHRVSSQISRHQPRLFLAVQTNTNTNTLVRCSSTSLSETPWSSNWWQRSLQINRYDFHFNCLWQLRVATWPLPHWGVFIPLEFREPGSIATVPAANLAYIEQPFQSSSKMLKLLYQCTSQSLGRKVSQPISPPTPHSTL